MKLTINGKVIEATDNCTILEAAAANNIHIPTLCYLKEINEVAACRMCLVEVDGIRAPQAACVTAAREGMVVETDTPALRESRRTTLELLCANHKMECTECSRGMNCELRNLCKEYGVDDKAFAAEPREKLLNSSECLVRDNTKCILCRRCVNTCKNTQGIQAIGVNFRGNRTNIGFGVNLSETDCVGCGQCVTACPTGALREKDDTMTVWRFLLSHKRKKAIAVVSPYVCTRIDELLGGSPEQELIGKTAAMLRRIGFDEIHLTGKNVTACPAWRNYLNLRHPDLADNLPADGTPWERVAQDIRAAEPEASITVITPCLAAKREKNTAYDAALTTRELVDMWKRACVSNYTAVEVWKELPEESFDTVAVETDDTVEIAKGLAEAEKLVASGMWNGESILACPGGCEFGGGSPQISSSARVSATPCQNSDT